MDAAALWADYAPRIAEARQQDAERQNGASLPLQIAIGDRFIVPLTVEKYLMLQQVGNRFFVDGNPDAEDVAGFLWLNSPDFDPDPKKGRKFVRKFKRKTWLNYLGPIAEYLQGVVEMAQSGGGSNSSWVAGLVDLLASQYHWTRSDIMATPMAQVFLLSGKMRARIAQNTTSFSPRADALQQEFMDKANAK